MAIETSFKETSFKDTSLSVLVVEDSRSTRKMEVKALTVLGFTNVSEAADGQEAMNIIEGGARPKLIISDWNMPEKNGYELLTWVRAHADPEVSGAAFIIATGRGEKENTVMAEKAGVSAMVTKPFSPPELAAVIEEAFGPKVEKPQEHPVFTPEVDAKGKVVFRIGHLQITDHIILGVLRSFIEEGKLNPKHFSLQTARETSWNPVQNKLEKGELGGAFMLAPIAMDLYQYGTPLQLVLFAHKNGSICVRRKPVDTEAELPLADFLRNKTFYIPHSLSIHHMLAHKFLTQLGLRPGMTGGANNIDVTFEVTAPVLMPDFITTPEAAGFIVAEPLGTKAISAGKAELMFLTGEMWESHPCCVVVLRKELVDQHPAAVSEFVNMLMECGRFVERRPDLAAFIGVSFLDPDGKLGLNTAILTNVLKESGGISTTDLYPVKAGLASIRDYMRGNMGIDLNVDLDQFVNTKFADQAYETLGIKPDLRINHIVDDAAGLVLRKTGFSDNKSHLQFEGRYLFFELDGAEYGIHIMYVREIIKMRELRSLPECPPAFKGVINLRNKVIPVLNLRTRLNMPEAEYTSGTCIIVVEQHVNERIMEIGLIVDSVSEVTDIGGKDIEPKPGLFASPEVLAYSSSGGRLRTLLAANLLLGAQDKSFMHQAVF